MKKVVYLNRNGANTDIDQNFCIDCWIQDSSIFDKPHIRQTLSNIESRITECMKGYYNAFNDETTRFALKRQVSDYILTNCPDIRNWRVVCDETNNSLEVIENRSLSLDLYIQPNRSTASIQLSTILKRGS